MTASDCTFCAGTGRLASCETKVFQGQYSRRNWVRDCQECGGTGKIDPDAQRHGRVTGLTIVSPVEDQ